MTVKMIIDTDPGIDDAMAIAYAAADPEIKVVGLTTIFGNVYVEQGTRNALHLVEMLGLDCPVAEGAAEPLAMPLDPPSQNVHGPEGFGGLPAPTPSSKAIDESAAEFLVRMCNESPNEVVICAIGPLTNLAAAETKQPGILKKAKEIIVMGGAFHCRGNVTPTAEFNIWFNPQAAQAVFDSRDDIVLLPLDVTRELVFTQAMADVVTQHNPDSSLAQFVVKLCHFMVGTALESRETARVPGFLVHDAATVGYLCYPETLLLKRARMQVETQGDWTMGQTLMDERHQAKSSANAWIALQVDIPNFFASFVEDLKQLI